MSQMNSNKTDTQMKVNGTVGVPTSYVFEHIAISHFLTKAKRVRFFKILGFFSFSCVI
jgi:hypothetical protein